MSAAEEVIEEVVEMAQETADLVEEIKQVPVGGYILVGAVAGAVGGVVAYFVGKKLLEKKYEKIAQEEIAQAKEFYNEAAAKRPVKLHVIDREVPAKAKDEAISQAADAIRAYQGEAEDEGEEGWEDTPPEEPEEEGSLNVYLQDTPDDDFDIDEEMKHRTPDEPYVISQQEFLGNEFDFSQTTLTWYLGDKTLADEREQDIPYLDPIVGAENLSRFGDGSGDPRVVYIRNERLSAEYEVVQHDGKFSHEVLGLQHSDGGARGRRQMNQPRKYRGEDE